MRKGIKAETVGIFPYRPGEPIFETERITHMNYLPFLKGGNNEKFDIEDLAKPNKDEFKTLRQGLKFLKYNEADAEELYNLIGGAIKLASSVVTVIGIISTVADLAKRSGLFGQEEMSTNAWLEKISERIEQIYGYLARENRRGLYNESLGWRIANEGARADQWNVRISRSPGNLDALKRRAAELDNALRMMLDPNKANIAFQKSVYGYAKDMEHWIDAAGTPALMRADGATLPPYGNQELQSEIWDAGHYIDVLFSALRERLIITTALEPAFRSTGYDRAVLLEFADKLQKFIAKWRSSLLVANPVAGINGGNKLYYPFANPDHAAYGILIGAVDPVTGISSLQQFSKFNIKYSGTFLPFEARGGVWDTSKAVEPERALTAAMSAHADLVDSVIRACGIDSLIQLEKQFRIAAAPPTESQFVRLPDAKFQFTYYETRDFNGSRVPIPTVNIGTPETIDLGRLKPFAADPNKTYAVTRYSREMEKTFRFKMARRTELSQIQLGYRLRIADLDIVLCPFSTRPPEGTPYAMFPSEPIEKDHRFATDIYDCCQIRHFSASDEDYFEREGENGERLFHNMRRGHGHIQVSVQFEPFVCGASDAHAGETIVKIRNLEPEDFPDSFILEVSVFETIVDFDGQKVEYPADLMTIHMTPSYLIVGQDFLDDMWDATARMIQTIKGINDRFSLEELVPKSFEPDPNPVWKIRRRPLEIENGLAYIQATMRERPELVIDQIKQFHPPFIR